MVDRGSTLSNKFWLSCLFIINLASCLGSTQVNQPISTLHFFNVQQMFLLRDKLITRGEKRETSTQRLQRNNVATHVEGFCISYFAALTPQLESRVAMKLKDMKLSYLGTEDIKQSIVQLLLHCLIKNLS